MADKLNILSRRLAQARKGVGLSQEGRLAPADPFVLTDLKVPDESPALCESVTASLTQEQEEAIVDWALDGMLEDYLSEMKDRRLREVSVREKYVRRSLNTPISESQKKLGQYEERKRKGEDMDAAIRQEQRHYEDLIARRDELLASLEQQRHLTLSSPEVMGVTVILPLQAPTQQLADVMARDEEVEAIAMELVLHYEREQGRIPEDVSAENLGFDIRSKGNGEIRYIEVKGRAGVGAVALTPNEWIKAQRFGKEYWLYIVVNAKTKPQLFIIQDPAAKLKPNKDVEVVRYLVAAEQWQKVAQYAGGAESHV